MKKLFNKLPFLLAVFILLILGIWYFSSNSNKTALQGNTIAATDISQSPVKLQEATVTKGVDGDVVCVKFEDGKQAKVRFIGINAPESTTKHEKYGEEAFNYTKSQLVGKTVYLEKDTSNTDSYGRLLRYVWLSPPIQINEAEVRNKMFNAILASEGYAEQMTVSPNVRYANYFKTFCEEARVSSKGLWEINPKGTTKGDRL
ncbi:thermonuclease family protein [Clostridium sp. WILCCON 0269]|uniref:Thermonuclease family protein n=1 Tax=Candidatus Clostridium eludens TaxID=3381663 RepID=A0ABW8SRX7_9CLOT